MSQKSLSRLLSLALLLASFVLPAVALHAAEWNQYRGPEHDGSASVERSLVAWPEGGPKVLWRADMGEGFGEVAAAGGRAYVLAERGGQEVTVALDALSGKELWATPLDKTIFEHQGGNGPRTTPAIDHTAGGDRVYVLGTYLKLACLNAVDGKLVWSHDLAGDYKGQQQLSDGSIHRWGSAISPTLDGNLVYVAGGGSGAALMAFDKTTGAVVWQAENDTITHASPTIGTLHGVRQIIYFTQSGLVSLSLDHGRVLWRFPYPYKVSTAASPVICGDIVYCSAGYKVGGGACKVTLDGAILGRTVVRTENKTISHWSTPVYFEGHLYGIFDHLGDSLKCVDAATGKELWSRKGFGPGGTTRIGKTLLVQAADGRLVLVEASADAYHELGSANPFTKAGGKSWNAATVSDGKIFARSTKEVVCIDAGK